MMKLRAISCELRAENIGTQILMIMMIITDLKNHKDLLPIAIVTSFFLIPNP